MATTANSVGTVVLIEGVSFAVNSAGERRQLKFGDPVFEGDVVETAEGARLELAFDHGGMLLLRSHETVTLDATVFGNLLPGVGDGALLPRVGEFTTILKAIAEGKSLDGLLEDPAAGLTSNLLAGNARSDDGNSFVALLRIAEALPPPNYEYRSGDISSQQRVEALDSNLHAVAPVETVVVGSSAPSSPVFTPPTQSV